MKSWSFNLFTSKDPNTPPLRHFIHFHGPKKTRSKFDSKIMSVPPCPAFNIASTRLICCRPLALWKFSGHGCVHLRQIGPELQFRALAWSQQATQVHEGMGMVPSSQLAMAKLSIRKLLVVQQGVLTWSGMIISKV